METKIIKILEVNNAISKTNKPYWQIVTDQGKTSTFDEGLSTELRKLIGKTIECEYEQNGVYWNIRLVKRVIENAPSSVSEFVDDRIGLSAKMKRKAEMMAVAKDIVLSSDIANKELVSLTNTIKTIWKNLMREIGEPVNDEDDEMPLIEKK